MSAKRQATTNLNHENWDREEEPEERGTFRAAPEDELSKRVIKKARRKNPGTNVDSADGGELSAKSVFSGFAGFGKAASGGASLPSAAASSPFSFLSKLPSTGTSTSSSSTASKPTFSFGGAATTTATSPTDANKLESNKTKDLTAPISTSPESSNDSAAYYAKLKGLNQAVSDWIKTHVDKNPLCILTPIFKDYDGYLKEIEKVKESTNKAEDDDNDKPTAAANTTAFSSFKFSATTSTVGAVPTGAAPLNTATTSNIFGSVAKPIISEAPKTNGFSFGVKPNDKPAPALTNFSFGNPSSSNMADSSGDKKPVAPTTGFSFTSGSAPFSFGNIQPPAALPTASSNADEEDEEDQPPKVEFKQVIEDDAVYSKKCKVFVKKDGNFVDRGVGTVFLKPVKDTVKTQLLVRADTNLGNILVNFILSSGIPAQRMGKNNVMLVCLPTPDLDKPTPMLLRVKTAEEADDLLATIEKYKK